MEVKWAILIICVCVLVQMLSTPVTALSLADAFDMLIESDFEDPSMLPLMPDLRPFSALRLQVDRHAIPHLPMLLTSVFHPPLN